MVNECTGAGDPLALLAGAVVSHEPYLRAFVQVSLSPALRDKESVSDIVQSTIRQVLESPGTFTFRSEAELRGWLRQAAHHKILNRIRRGRTQKRAGEDAPADPEGLPERHDSSPGPVDHVVRSEELEALKTALDELPEEVAEAVRLHRILGLSLEAIAQLHGEPASTIGSRVQRGMVLLASRMRPLR